MIDKNLKLATFGAGCFWQTEEDFRIVPGVTETTAGFMGGRGDKPSYEDVSHKDTGHAEVVHIKYDPTKVTYQELLDIFWTHHDPTTLNSQGPDVGEQYRSVIFWHDSEQAEIAQQSKQEMSSSNKFKNKIVTQIEAAGDFWEVEEYHQKYLFKRGMKSCHV